MGRTPTRDKEWNNISKQRSKFQDHHTGLTESPHRVHTVIAGGITQNNHKESPHRVREWEHNMSRWRHQKEFTLLKGSVTGLDWRLGTTEDKYCRATKIRQSTRLHQRKCELSFSRALAIRNYSWDSMSAQTRRVNKLWSYSLDLFNRLRNVFCERI